MFALYGKLPGAGDFLTINVPRAVLRPLEDWLSASMTQAHEHYGETWEAMYDGLKPWRFWIGADVLGAPMAGVMAHSRDRVGRRFPVLVFETASSLYDMPDPPVLDPDQEQYAAIERMIEDLKTQSTEEVRGALEALNADEETSTIGQAPDPEQNFWAAAPQPGAEAFETMMEDVRDADHRGACKARSFWWSPGSDATPPVCRATTGLPEGEVFAWFMQGLEGATNEVASDQDLGQPADLGQAPEE